MAGKLLLSFALSVKSVLALSCQWFLHTFSPAVGAVGSGILSYKIALLATSAICTILSVVVPAVAPVLGIVPIVIAILLGFAIVIKRDVHAFQVVSNFITRCFNSPHEWRVHLNNAIEETREQFSRENNQHIHCCLVMIASSAILYIGALLSEQSILEGFIVAAVLLLLYIRRSLSVLLLSILIAKSALPFLMLSRLSVFASDDSALQSTLSATNDALLALIVIFQSWLNAAILSPFPYLFRRLNWEEDYLKQFYLKLIIRFVSSILLFFIYTSSSLLISIRLISLTIIMYYCLELIQSPEAAFQLNAYLIQASSMSELFTESGSVRSSIFSWTGVSQLRQWIQSFYSSVQDKPLVPSRFQILSISCIRIIIVFGFTLQILYKYENVRNAPSENNRSGNVNHNLFCFLVVLTAIIAVMDDMYILVGRGFYSGKANSILASPLDRLKFCLTRSIY